MITTKMIKTNGLNLEVDICGDGEKFALCLHGFPESAHSWRFLMPVLAGLGYRVWASNLRGYGSSDRPENLGAYEMKNLLADVEGIIDAAGAESTLLIAHDWGGIIAWQFALEKRRPIERYVALNIPHPEIFSRKIKKWPQLFRSWYVFFFLIPKLPEFMLGLGGAKAIGDMFSGMAIDKKRFPAELLSVYRKNAQQKGALTAMINYYRANFSDILMGGDERFVGVMIDVPTLMIWGEEDTALGKELTYGTEKLVEDFTIRYLPKVSHWVQQEAPEQVNNMIKAWLLGIDVPYGQKL